MPLVNLSVNSDPERPGIFSIKVNDHEINQHITEMSLTIKAGRPPELTLKACVDTLTLGCAAMTEIPEPYRGLYKDYEQFFQECRQSFESHK